MIDMSAADSSAVAKLARVQLIVNADDFGLSSKTNDGIIAAHNQGIVTSASLMVRQPAAHEAVERATAFPRLDLGLHIDLGEWIYRDAHWDVVYQVVELDDAAAVEREVRRQIEWFLKRVGRPPTHFDSHQHVHRQEPVRSVVVKCATEMGVPVRHNGDAIRYCGDFYGQGRNGQSWPDAIEPPGLIEVLSQLTPGVTELACHPGWDQQLPTMYVQERPAEVATLCDSRVRAFIGESGIELITFADVAHAV